MQDSFTPNQCKFIEWLATPRHKRMPPTIELFADSIRINATTLYRWKKIDGFQDEVTAMARQGLGAALPDIYGALIREADQGNVPAIKLAFEMTGEYTPKQQTEHSGSIDDSGLSDDDRAIRIAAILDAARARRDRSDSSDGDS